MVITPWKCKAVKLQNVLITFRDSYDTTAVRMIDCNPFYLNFEGKRTILGLQPGLENEMKVMPERLAHCTSF